MINPQYIKIYAGGPPTHGTRPAPSTPTCLQ